MPNGYRGEITVELAAKDYPLLVNMSFLARFKTVTGKDFNTIASKALTAFAQMRDSQLPTMLEQTALIEACPLELVTRAFYLAANAADSKVELDEIADGVLAEGALRRKSGDVWTESYPIKFVQLASFALLGIYEPEEVKKNSLEPS